MFFKLLQYQHPINLVFDFITAIIIETQNSLFPDRAFSTLALFLQLWQVLRILAVPSSQNILLCIDLVTWFFEILNLFVLKFLV